MLKQTVREVESMCKDIGGHKRLFVNLRKCVGKPGVKVITIFVLKWLEIETMIGIALAMKTITHTLIACWKLKLLVFLRL